MSATIHGVLRELVGQQCQGADNPYGSIFRLEIGPLRHRHLTIYSPWRLDGPDRVICDWNFPGGAKGTITPLTHTVIGRTVESATADPPGWDLQIVFSGGLVLKTFNDSEEDPGDAWTILGTNGLEISARPIYGP